MKRRGRQYWKATRALRPLRPLGTLGALGALCINLPALADPARAPKAELTQGEIETWLGTRPSQEGPVDRPAATDAPPPSPPRAHGFLVEGSVGAFGHVGSMRSVSPPAPRFALHVGYEFLDWLALFAEGDLVFGTTSNANPPPKPRSYTLYGAGGGLRFHLGFSERFGVQLEGSAGLSQVSEDILGVYGYKDADELKLYFGGRLGLEWYPVNPHYTVSLFGAVRDYPQFRQTGSSRVALAWQGGIALAYAF